MSRSLIGSARTAAGARTVVSRSNILNGDFENAPPFTAATNTASTFIDGTAGGSLTNTNYGWAIGINASAFQAQFDSAVSHSGTSSLKLSCTNTTGRGFVELGRNSASGSIPARIMEKFLMPITPNATYVISCWIKTNNAASGAVNGQWIRINSSFASIGSNFTLFGTNNGTQDWTYQKTTVILGASDAYLQLRLFNNVAGNVSDAWFDDIVLTGPVRTAA